MRPGLIILTYVLSISSLAQEAGNKPYVSKVWVADNGDGSYKNPILHADYSDPDAIRVGEDYYMVSSSFNHAPGLPILHSKDLVNWTLIGHALSRQTPYAHFALVQHGNGVWAPSIRYHKGEFYIYYPDPDFGIYLIKAKNIRGPWTEPVLVEAGKGLIDPCPLWDDNGEVYLVHAYAGSRAGIKSIIVIKQMNAEGTRTIDAGTIVYDGHLNDPTIEGPKFHKRNGWYYIFAPAGGVSTGWQLVLRSKNIYGPYERRIVMEQGTSSINGPHQGAWVDTKVGEHWFLHFQDKGAFGRVVHLQPLKWINDWPVIGVDKNEAGKGEPVLRYKKPNVGKSYPITTPLESDEFNGNRIGYQWQWQANPKATWSFADATNGLLRLFADKIPDSNNNFWFASNLLMQKFPADKFMATVKLSFYPKLENDMSGLIIMGIDYAHLSLIKKSDGNYLAFVIQKQADKGVIAEQKLIEKMEGESVWLRVNVAENAECSFSYSKDGSVYEMVPWKFIAKPGRWVGAKLGIFCSREKLSNDSGYADFDWFRLQ